MYRGSERPLKDLESHQAHTQKVLIKMFRLSKKYPSRDTAPLKRVNPPTYPPVSVRGNALFAACIKVVCAGVVFVRGSEADRVLFEASEI